MNFSFLLASVSGGRGFLFPAGADGANGRRSFLAGRLNGRGLVLAGVAALALAAPARAVIQVDNSRHDEREGFRGDFRYYSNRGNFDAAIRMGMATFEGTTYYAYVMQDGRAIRVSRAEDEGGKPTGDGNFVCDIAVPDSDKVPNPGYLTGNAIVVGLVPRDGLLYLICRAGRGKIFVQALKTSVNGRRVVPAGTLKTIDSQVDTGRSDAYCVGAGAVNGDAGLYVHGLWTPGNGQNLKLATFLLKPNGGDFERVAVKDDVPASARGFMVNANDAAGTLEFNPQGELDEVHYFTWGAGNDHIWLARFRPANGARSATYDSVADSGIMKMDSGRNASTLTLMEGGMNGDTSNQYGLSLIEFATNVGGGGERSDGEISVLRQISLSTATHNYAGGWSQTNFSFEGTSSNRHLAYFSTAHWGIDKTRITAGVGAKPKRQFDRALGNTKFLSEMQQRFRFSILAFYTKQQFASNYDYTSFHTGDVRGNRFITDPRDPNKDAITTLDTTDALAGGERLPLFDAWTLVGVVHGVPPYVPFRDKKGYPSLSFTYVKTATKEFSVSDTTEDSKEITVAVSIGGGDIARGAGAAKGVFSVEGSYSYGVTSVDGATTTNSKTNSVKTSQTFEPDEESTTYAPDRIGVLFYSAPTFVSKGYAVRRWNGDTFTDTARNVYQTVVARRELKTLYYLLDSPDEGPLMGLDPKPNAAYAPLTAGIPPVPRTSNFPRWRVPNLTRDLDSYDQFNAAGDTASFTASYLSSGSFSLDYTETDSQSHTHALTKTHKGTVSVSGGLKDIFSINVTGSISSSNTFSTTSTATTSVGQGISGEFPKLTRGEGQDISEITSRAYLLYSKDNSSPEWTPTALRGGSSPFLLTWSTRVSPPRFGRRLHGFSRGER